MGLQQLRSHQFIILRMACFTALLGAQTYFPGESAAQLSDNDRARLVSQIRYDTSQITEDRFPDLELAQQDVAEKIGLVRQFMLAQRSRTSRELRSRYVSA